MKTFPFYPKRKSTQLDGLWDFTFIGTDMDLELLVIDNIVYDDSLPVPSAFDAFPAYSGWRGTAAYRTFLKMTPGVSGLLEFQSVGIWCAIYVDGKRIMTHHPAYVPFTCEIPADAELCEREIVVVVDNRYDEERAPLQENIFDFYNYGGILRSVTAFELPDCYIKFCHVTPLDIATGEVSIKLYLDGLIPESVDLELTFDAAETMECSSQPVIDGTVSLKVPVPSARVWSPEAPNLHILRVAIDDDDIMAVTSSPASGPISSRNSTPFETAPIGLIRSWQILEAISSRIFTSGTVVMILSL